MRTVFVITICLQLAYLAGCAGNERVYGNIYEGLKTREMNVNPNQTKKSDDLSGIRSRTEKAF